MQGPIPSKLSTSGRSRRVRFECSLTSVRSIDKVVCVVSVLTFGGFVFTDDGLACAGVVLCKSICHDVVCCMRVCVHVCVCIYAYASI